MSFMTIAWSNKEEEGIHPYLSPIKTIIYGLALSISSKQTFKTFFDDSSLSNSDVLTPHLKSPKRTDSPYCNKKSLIRGAKRMLNASLSNCISLKVELTKTRRIDIIF